MLNTIMEADEDSGGESHSQNLRANEKHEPYAVPDIYMLSTYHRLPINREEYSMPLSGLSSEPSFVQISQSSDQGLQWSRESISTQTTEIDDLHEIFDSEKEPGLSKHIYNKHNIREPPLLSLITPTKSSLNMGDFPVHFDYSFFVPSTYSPKISISSTIYSFLVSHHVLSSSATPSLDGSLNSEQPTDLSPPTTPDMSDDQDEHNDWGLQLDPNAMATLLVILGEDKLYDQLMEQVNEIQPMSPAIEMQQSHPQTMSLIRRHESVVLPPYQQRFLSSLTDLEIPSPGGFFANLSEGSRYSWVFEPIIREIPPSPSTAEQFYRIPWTEPSIQPLCVDQNHFPSCSVETPSFNQRETDQIVCGSQVDEGIVITELIEWNDYDETYVRKLHHTASKYSDRTRSWLATQRTSIGDLINSPEDRGDEIAMAERHSITVRVRADNPNSSGEKLMKFVGATHHQTKEAPDIPLHSSRPASTFFFNTFLSNFTHSHYHNANVHRLPRFQALQTQRSSFPQKHRHQLLGRYCLDNSLESVERRISANVVRSDMGEPVNSFSRFEASKHRETLDQMMTSIWNIQALRSLGQGELLTSPILNLLTQLSGPDPACHRSHNKNEIRILDLGGRASCDWSWHIALSHPRANVYTLISTEDLRTSNTNTRGPENHHIVTTAKFTRLPFPDSYFECVSARSFHSLLKAISVEGKNEWLSCLAEISRVLKPGGYLEFRLIDSEILHAGPLANVKAKEFAILLKQSGYDPHPTATFISYLYTVGYTKIKRAWTFLPMGVPNSLRAEKGHTFVSEIKDEVESVQYGSMEFIAPLAGIVGSIEWERWMATLDMENGGNGSCLLDNWNVFEEGRHCGAGWRVLSGWARKEGGLAGS